MDKRHVVVLADLGEVLLLGVRVDGDAFIGSEDMRGSGVGLGVHAQGRNTELLRRTDDS